MHTYLYDEVELRRQLKSTEQKQKRINNETEGYSPQIDDGNKETVSPQEVGAEVCHQSERRFPPHPTCKMLRESLDGNYTLLFQPQRGYAGTQLGEVVKRFKPAFTRGAERKKREHFLQAFVWNCYRAVQYEVVVQETEPSRTVWVSYDRKQELYRRDKRYGLLHFSYPNMRAVIAQAMELDWIEEVRGSIEEGERSKFRPVGGWRGLLKSLDVNADTMKSLQTTREVVFMRDTKATSGGAFYKCSVGYSDNDKTRLLRKNIKAINRINKQHRWSIRFAGFSNPHNPLSPSSSSSPGSCSEPVAPVGNVYCLLPIMGFNKSQIESFCPLFSILPSESVFDTIEYDLGPEIAFKRIFNNGSWDQGGRFYGCIVQTMPKEWRPFVLIDDGPTVEIDYASMHVAMCYHLEGSRCPDKPYDVSSLVSGWTDLELLRANVKAIALTWLNASSKREALWSLVYNRDVRLESRDSDLDHRWQVIKDLMAAFELKHPLLKKKGYLRSGVGLRLQNLDSQIAERVMMTFAELKKPILCVHDSFIVKQEDRELLRDTMVAAYRDQPELQGYTPRIKSAMPPAANEDTAKSVSVGADIIGLRKERRKRNGQLRKTYEPYDDIEVSCTLHLMFG